VILLDTSVLVYAVGDAHALRAPCREVLGGARRGLVAARTTVEVVQEFAHVRARRRPRADATRHARDFVRGLGPLLVTTSADLALGLDLFERTSLGAFDAVLAAVALNNEAEALVSADRAFAEVPGLVCRTPHEVKIPR
jgi:predicted nucleic acid-binding protein